MNDPEKTNKKIKAKPFPEAIPSSTTNIKTRKQQVVRDALSTTAMEFFLARGFESVTVEEIATAAGVSRRTFFRYYESKEDVLVATIDSDKEVLLTELAARPPDEPVLLAIRNALIPTIEYNLQNPDLVRDTTRLLRETSALRRAVMERRSRIEERIAALMVERLKTTGEDATPMLLAFLTRALYDTVLNAWYDNETDNIQGLIDHLLHRLHDIVTEYPR